VDETRRYYSTIPRLLLLSDVAALLEDFYTARGDIRERWRTPIPEPGEKIKIKITAAKVRLAAKTTPLMPTALTVYT
jgi:hypothetical protein